MLVKEEHIIIYTTGFGAICKGGGSTIRVNWSTANQGLAGGSGSGGSSANGN